MKTMLYLFQPEHHKRLSLILAFLFLLLGGDIVRAQIAVSARQTPDTDRRYSGKELQDLNPINLWDALKQLDPSLTETDENTYGSDPNNIPTSIEIRGKNQWASSNQPIFILDEARVTARRIYDLRIDNIAEVIIRKDPLALTSKGIRGGQGVVEIHTKRPDKGSLRLSYTFDGSLQRADLSSYHLMNAGEKLDFEKQSGLYRSSDPARKAVLQALLDERETTVAKGADHDWLREPLQTAFTHRHSVNVAGGDDFVRYNLTLRATPGSKGIMKKSKRDLYGGDAYVEYRYRTLTLSNHINVDKIYSTASPYGNFDYYALLNPYYESRDTQEFIYNSLGEGSFNEQANPVHETSLSSFNKMEGLYLYDNFKASYTFLEKFRLDGNFAFTRDHTQQEIYVSPESFIYEETGKLAGAYEISRKNMLSYEGNTALAYDNHLQRSAYGLQLAMNIYQGKTDYDNYSGIGIPIDRMAYISFATSYAIGKQPDAGESYDRMLSGLLTGYYTYDNRYLFRFNLRIDRASQLAPEKQRAAFYGLGVQWNLHNESFLKGKNIFDRLTLDAAIGTAGSIDFAENAYTLMYNYNINDEYIYNYYLIGAHILGLTNPEMKWSTTTNKSITLKAQRKGISVYLNYYDNNTHDLPIILPVEPATGFENQPSNGGRIRNYGVEYTLSVRIPDRPQGVHLTLFTNGIHHRNKITSLPEYFRNYYNSNQIRYASHPFLLEKGQSLNTIYAVTSLGVDASGTENFLTKEGNSSTKYFAEDLVASGENLPKLKGNFGFRLGWRQWSLNTWFNYTLGGKFYNETLAAVQNNSPAYNMDRRGLNKGIRAKQAEAIPATSRFVEKKNEIGLGSLRIGYDFTTSTAQKMGLQNLNLYLTGNQLFHSSSADYQRGICYPFARTVTLSVRATF